MHHEKMSQFWTEIIEAGIKNRWKSNTIHLKMYKEALAYEHTVLMQNNY